MGIYFFWKLCLLHFLHFLSLSPASLMYPPPSLKFMVSFFLVVALHACAHACMHTRARAHTETERETPGEKDGFLNI